MGSFEKNYGDEGLRMFTEKERAQLRALHQRLDEKVDEIAYLMAKQLGYDKADPRAREEADQAIDRWEEDAEMARGADRQASASAARASFDRGGHHGHSR